MAADRRIALMIGTMEYGGAEIQATVLANGLARAGREVSLLVSSSRGPLCERLSGDVRLHCLGRRSRWDVVRLMRRLLTTLDEEKPDVLYAFMPGANLAACLAKLRFPKLKVAWGVRASSVELEHYGFGAQFAGWLERRLSRWPNLIIANSAAGRRHAIAQGFPDGKHFIVIANGIDVERFRPDAALRKELRDEWGVLPQEKLVGIVARLDPMKDYPNFLQAAAKVQKQMPEVRFVSVGVDSLNLAGALREQARSLGLEERMIWAGARENMRAVYSAIDLLVLSSVTESFPNVLGEAMACGKPCVATDVGDAREIVGDCGALVPPRDTEALARAIVGMLERIGVDGARLAARVRERIVENFAVETLVRRTNEALDTIP